ncbi:MAG TPA: hypothetical protein VN903_35045, partial [Polyangia bacterium]|nr:hypothetical protein [Polyangia bacterium]
MLEKAPGERSPLIIEFARGSSVELALLTRAELDALTRQIAEKDAKLAELQGEIDNHNCTTHALNLA